MCIITSIVHICMPIIAPWRFERIFGGREISPRWSSVEIYRETEEVFIVLAWTHPRVPTDWLPTARTTATLPDSNAGERPPPRVDTSERIPLCSAGRVCMSACC